MGDTVADLLAGFGPINRVARERGIPTVGVSHGTVNGCLTEHGVPMAGLDHEFTTGALSAARASAFMLGHIHKHQVWECGGRLIAYPGSIGRFHYGEAGDKGFLIWDVGADGAGLEFVATPAKRTLDIVFDGKPDMDRLRAEAQTVDGAFVRVRWSVLEEERASVDRVAIEAALAGAAGLQLEGRVIPMIAARAAGISALPNIAEKVRRWAQVTEIDPEPMVACLEALHSGTPEAIATAILGEASSIASYPLSRLEAST